MLVSSLQLSKLAQSPSRLVLASATQREFSTNPNFNKMAIPLQKLKFIEHPRYGSVYPVVSIDKRHEWPRLARFSTAFLSMFNASILYSTFFTPIYTAEFAAIVANPLFLIPSLWLNSILYRRNYALFYQDRSLVTSIFLKPCGTKFIAETRDGDMAEVTIQDLFMVKALENKFDNRIEFQHGANIYKQIRGNARIMDDWVLSHMFDNKNIDTQNAQYDFDLTKEFTWDFRELVEIKKRKRFVSRTYKPTFKVLAQVKSA